MSYDSVGSARPETSLDARGADTRKRRQAALLRGLELGRYGTRNALKKIADIGHIGLSFEARKRILV